MRRGTASPLALRRSLRRLVWSAIGAGAGRAETIGGALVKAYLTNPDINTQRAAVRVADEGVPKANAGYLPTVEATGNIGIQRGQGETSITGARRVAGSEFPCQSAGIWRSSQRDRLQRQPHAQLHPSGGVAGFRGAGAIAQHRAEHSSFGRHRLYGRAGGHGDSRPRQQQRRRAERTAARDAGPLHRRRGDAHRRGAGGSEPGSGPGDRAQRCGDPAGRGRALPSVHRRSADQPCAGEAAYEAAAENPARGDIDLADRASGDQRLSAWRRRGAIAGEDRRGRALSDHRALRLGQPTSTTSSGEPGIHVLSGQIMGQITIPIYQGGAEYASTRQAKESLSQQEIQTDSLRNQVRQAVVAAWGLNRSCSRRGARRPRGGLRQRSGADRRARRGQGRPADDARRAQRPAGFIVRRERRWFRPNTTRSSIPISCCRRSAGSTSRPSDLRSPSTIRGCISIR